MENGENADNDLFYFESDHLAVKGNKDYSELMKTLFILTAQREKAIKDYDTVSKIKKECLENPLEAVEKIKNNDLGIPPLQVIADLPKFDWHQYKTKVSEAEINAIYESQAAENNENYLKLDQKNTHQKPWTSEEQKRLEELLIIFPPEPIEIRRIKKIAMALGNRTVKQVSSRLQKYFLKLHRAGLPVPGRIPKGFRRAKQKVKHPNLWKPTSFFPQYNVSINMDDSTPAPGPSSSYVVVKNEPENYLLSTNYHLANTEPVSEKSEQQLQLELLKKAKAEKLREASVDGFRHVNYKCDYCQEEPIVGSRWHCTVCVTDSIDFCTDCLIAQLYSDNCHPLSHKLMIIRGIDDDDDDSLSEDSDSEFTNNNSEISDGGTDTVNRNSFNFNENDNMNDLNNLSTQDVSYNYLHSQTNLFKNE